MNSSKRIDPTEQYPEKRTEHRSTKLSNHRVEIKFPSVPVYQLKVRDVSPNGAGIIVRADSKFLSMVQTGQELDVNFISPVDAKALSGPHTSRIEHISELEGGRYRGHWVVGISILR